MTSLVLYCKSYRTDLRRVVRMATSVQQFNTTGLPLFVSVPAADMELFASHLTALGVRLLSDESILECMHPSAAEKVARMPGHIAQQVIKSEFWRMGHSDAYVCLDSDAIFIREFSQADFIAPDGTPYTMLDEAHDLLEQAMQSGKTRIVDDFMREADLVQSTFGRTGRRYSFGPFPLVWHRAVWESLERNYLAPKGWHLADAIEQAPIESRWYGESLLAYQAVPLLPCQALFKVYHYAWQLDRDRAAGVTNAELARLFCGVIYQSSWEREMDWPQEGGHIASRLGRRLRRWLGRI